MIMGAIIGAVVALFIVLYMFNKKEQTGKKVLASLKEPGILYSGVYHYASASRYKKGMKFFDSYGLLYLVGHTLYYKTSEGAAPLTFNLKECTVQREPDWRKLKWFSVTTPSGEKHYFDSHKMGAFINNSDETLKGLEAIQAAKNS